MCTATINAEIYAYSGDQITRPFMTGFCKTVFTSRLIKIMVVVREYIHMGCH